MPFSLICPAVSYRIISIIATLHLVSSLSGNSITLTVHEDGAYDLTTSQRIWLRCSSTWFIANNETYSTENGTLLLVHTKIDAGKDNLGVWNSTTLRYVTAAANEEESIAFEVIFKTYRDVPVITFGQIYLQDVYWASSGDKQKVSSSFPAFQVPHQDKLYFHPQYQYKKSEESDLGYYAVRGYMAGDDKKAYGRWNSQGFRINAGQNIGPIALFDPNGQTLIISPFKNFMALSVWNDVSSCSLNYGILGKASMVPKGTEIWTMVHYSEEGINKGFNDWGTSMKKYYGAQNEKYAESDLTQNYLGYWTDNGAFYYYNTEKNKTYQETIFDLKLYADSLGIPFNYIQYDSWFYPKSHDLGILDWVPDVKAFPSGLHYVQEKTGWSVAAHCKWWSPKTPLAKQNGGQYDFIIENKMALPVDQKLWIDILKAGKQWDLMMFEQDWLGQMFDGLSILQTNVTVGREWMLQMAEGVRRNGLVMQQCTAYPRHTLMALEIPMVTQQRVTMDYALADYNWRVGVTSLWVSSLGQTPFKDIFWTTPDQHCPKYPSVRHPYVELHSLVSSLTTGPVAPSDGINNTDRTLLMRCCNEDGLLLKPDRPATAIDSQFYEAAFTTAYPGPKGEVWSTHSTISGLFFGIIFAADLNETFFINPSLAGFPKTFPDSVAYSRNLDIIHFGPVSQLALSNCTKMKFCIYYTAPIINIQQTQVILFGEITKWIPFSKNRIQQIEQSGSDVTLKLVGAIEEIVQFWVKVGDSSAHAITCVIPQTRTVTLSVLSSTCQ